MRLLSLDLERFGPFTDKRLVFRPDARLHVVHRRERGRQELLARGRRRTCCSASSEHPLRLRACRQGAAPRRGAARPVDGRGAPPSAAARTSRSSPTDADDAPLPDDVAVAVSRRPAREVFRRAFGLDAEALRKSAEDLRHSDGELGAALFSAASGLRGVSDAQGCSGERGRRDLRRAQGQGPHLLPGAGPLRGRPQAAAGQRDPRGRPEGAARAGGRPRTPAQGYPGAPRRHRG